MDTIQRKYEQSPKRNTFVFRHRAGTAVILPLLGLLLGVLAIALALTDVSLWWLAVVVAIPVGLVDEARAARRHSGLGVGRLCEERSSGTDPWHEVAGPVESGSGAPVVETTSPRRHRLAGTQARDLARSADRAAIR
jgi:hypothetical protein